MPLRNSNASSMPEDFCFIIGFYYLLFLLNNWVIVSSFKAGHLIEKSPQTFNPF